MSLSEEGLVETLPSPHQQWEKITASVESVPLIAGTHWYIISAQWLRKWQRFCHEGGGNSADVGRISNQDIVHPLAGDKGLTSIKEVLVPDEDYVVVPEEAWNMLVSWYGVASSSRSIPRPVVKRNGEACLEIVLPIVRYKMGKGPIRVLSVLSGCTLADLKQLVFPENDISVTSLEDELEGAIVFLVQTGTSCRELGAEMDNETVEDLGLFSPMACLLIQIPSQMVIDSLFKDSDSSMPSSTSSVIFFAFEKGAGIKGLRNLGNTCFMNSALQCLSNCESLTRYFLNGTHLCDLNRENPIGTGGILAETYGSLLRDLWSLSSSHFEGVVDPSKFKYSFGRFESRFMGYSQQDSQEFLSALLDRLHEDVNRIKKKPYIELTSSSGRPDLEVGVEAWDVHRKRNDSIIVDNFHGQYKSLVVCPVCNFESVTFDPFLFVSLPLPNNEVSSIEITLVQGISATKLKLPIDRLTASITDLINLIATEANVSSDDVVVVEIYHHEIYRVYPMDYPLSRINANDMINVYLKQHQNCFWISFKILESFSLGSPVAFPLLFHTDSKDYDAAIIHAISKIIAFSYPECDPDRIRWDQFVRISQDNILATDSPFPGFVVEFSTDYTQQDLNIDIRKVFDDFDSESSKICTRNETFTTEVTLKQCLDLFTMEEKLSPEELWYCNKCKHHQQASKKMDLWKLPDILVIHLKRFSYCRLWGQKISCPVKFPLTLLDFTSYLPPDASNSPSLYDIFAVSHHYGGLGGGHYTATAQNFVDGKWYHFDDSHVSESTLDSLGTLAAQKSAYMLFYKRRKP